MDKRYELNLEVKNSLAKALFILLDTKNISEITVSSLVIKAGVARASFYRNFKTKEDVLKYYLSSILNQYKSKYAPDLKHIARYENILRTFEYVLNYKFELSVLFKSNLGQFFLEAINQYIINETNLNKEKLLQRYPFYSYAGALYNTMYFWVTSGCKESPEKIAKEFFKSFHIN